MTSPILQVKNLTKKFGGLVAIDNVDFELPKGELRAVIGPNGAGKTTFFNLISGFLHADSGSVIFEGEDITGKPPHKISRKGMSRTLQIKSVFSGMTVYDNVWIAAHSRAKFLHPFKSTLKYAETAQLVDEVLEKMGLTSIAKKIAGNLSYGDLGLVEIAIAFATRPSLLLLDEPVAGMSPEETDRTVIKIKEFSKDVSIILIEHDMEVVFGVADVITVMNHGSILCQGRPEEISNDQRVLEAYLGTPEKEICYANT